MHSVSRTVAECLSVSRWFMLPQTFSRLQTVFTKGWAPLHFGAVWLFVFVVFWFCVFGDVLESARGVLTAS